MRILSQRFDRRTSRLSRRASAVAGVSLLAAWLFSCRGATEVVVEVRSDVACSKLGPVGVVVGPVGGLADRPLASQSQSCTDGPNGAGTGRIVLVPSADRNGEFAFAVMVNTKQEQPEVCLEDGLNNCITARRIIRYLPGESLTVRVDLRSSCVNVQCAEDSTCVQGKCATARVDASTCSSGCGEEKLLEASYPQGVGGEDGGGTGGDGAGGDAAGASAGSGFGAEAGTAGVPGGAGGPGGAECVSGETRCSNSVAEECSGGLWQTVTDCGSQGGACVEGVCVDTCASLLQSGSTVSGAQVFDPDGPGPLPATEVYCDMEWDGGGWALIRSNSGGTGAGVEGPVGPGANMHLPIEVMLALSKAATQVHIRTSGNTDEQITSLPGTEPILNLRQGRALHETQANWATVWTGWPTAVEALEAVCAPAVSDYPDGGVIDACGSTGGISWTSSTTSWDGTTPTTLELYVR